MRLAIAMGLLVTGLWAATASATPWLWQKPGGKYTNAVATAPDGSVAAALDAEVVRFDSTGKVVKAIGYGPRAVVTALTYAPDSDLLVVGYFKSEIDLSGARFTARKDLDGFVARYKPDGALRWAAQIESEEMTYVGGVAASGGRVLVAGWTRYGAAVIAGKPIAAGRGFVAVLDASGAVVAIPQQVELGNDGEMRSMCATTDGFVVAGWDRRKPEQEGFIRGLTNEGATRWTVAAEHQASDVACRGDTVFVATSGTSLPPKGNYSRDLYVLEIDGAGKPVRTLTVVTEVDDKPLQLSASVTELAITSRHSDGKVPAWSRVTRFASDGKLLGRDDYKGLESIFLRAIHGKAGLILVGEITRGARATIRGKELSGPTVFVSAP